MRKETKTFDVYKYEELSAMAKETAKKYCMDSPEMHEDFVNICEFSLRNYFPDNAGKLEIQYQLNHWKNDGFNIYGTIDAGSIIEYLKKNQERYGRCFNEEEKELILGYSDIGGLIVIPENLNGFECVAKDIVIKELWYQRLMETKQYYENINTGLLKYFEGKVIKIFKDLCKKFMEVGYYDFYTIDEEMIETYCEDYEYEFLADGTPYCM